MTEDDDPKHVSQHEPSEREQSADPLPSDGTQGSNAPGNAPTEGDEGGAGTEGRTNDELEDD
jgi:hypothetical protein